MFGVLSHDNQINKSEYAESLKQIIDDRKGPTRFFDMFTALLHIMIIPVYFLCNSALGVVRQNGIENVLKKLIRRASSTLGKYVSNMGPHPLHATCCFRSMH